jgi:hypothetical protein
MSNGTLQAPREVASFVGIQRDSTSSSDVLLVSNGTLQAHTYSNFDFLVSIEIACRVLWITIPIGCLDKFFLPRSTLAESRSGGKWRL